MMKNALVKDTLREVKNTFSRFISIFAIVAIGVGFFAGVTASGPDMKLTANKYFQDKRLMDLRLVSTMGFNHDDVAALKNTPGVSQVSPAHVLDVFIEKDNSKDEIRIHTLSDANTTNISWLVDGRMPKNSGECVVEANFLKNGRVQIGDTIKLLPNKDDQLSDTLVTDEYTIVGTVNNPLYISFDRGNSTIGNGTIDYYIMIPEEDVLLDYYTELFITSDKAQHVSSYSNEYEKTIEDVKNNLEHTATNREEERYQEILTEANNQLNDGKEELSEGKKKLEDGITKANNEFSKAQKSIDQGYSTLKKEEDNFWREINAAQNKIDTGLAQLKQGEQSYNDGYAQFLQGKNTLEETKKRLDDNKETMPEEEYLKAMEEYNAGITQLEATEQTLSATRVQLDAGNSSSVSGQKELNTQKSKGLSLLKVAKEDLEKGKKKLNDEQNKFIHERDSSQAKLNQAQIEIDKAEQEIAKIKKPIWYINTRNSNVGYTEYGQNADRIDAIAKVFPLFFLLVAALVSLTTMTRMIEEQRTHIGTLKALGYSKFSIVSKYFIYANLASVTGSIAGLLIGFQLFPRVIFSAYGSMYDLPPVITPFHYNFALFSVLAAVLCTSLSVLLACSKELHAQPATLMRPKSPKAGKRVLLEKIPFLWNRMTFTTKVTARNLFRYKKRMLMTVIGISGCTALMLTGFGIKDSISNISAIQFSELSTYDFMTIIDEDKDTQGVTDLLHEDANIEKSLPIILKSIDAKNEKEKFSTYLFVPQTGNKLDGFINLRTYKDHKQLQLKDDGVIITLKLSRLLEKKIGDRLIIEDSDGKETTVLIKGITENYISHYIYMTSTYYKEAFGEDVKINALLGDMKDNSKKHENELSEKLLELDNVLGLNFTQNNINSFDDTMGSLNYVVLVLIISASLLAFVVLYNLTNINVNERLREIATIKVLGFYNNEVSAYIYRENMVLTLMGTFVGFGLGVILHQFVIQTAEVNELMFGRIISIPSFVISGLLTLVFALCVNVVLHFRLKKIDMVESLKSVE